MNATKPQFRPRAFSSAVRGHMTLTDANGPYLPNVLHKYSSLICSQGIVWRHGVARLGENARRDSSLLPSHIRLWKVPRLISPVLICA